MKTLNRVKGIIGETAACEFLKKRGYKILERNFRGFNKEIDIIAEDGSTLCFMEVKTRKAHSPYGSGLEAIDRRKVASYKTAAICYIKKNNIITQTIRFDAVSVLLNEFGYVLDIELFKDAF